MIPFQFYALSEEDQAALRANTRRCTALLRPCKPLADKLAAQSFQSYRYEGAFDQLCQQAGLLHSDAGLLEGRVETLYRQREPALYEAETISTLEQWLRNKSSESDE